uniref:Uncharacterized protein n=1 Tax=Arundo donax TaxID=35708 RepID=A0A0A9HV41_ARUDO
MIGRVTYKERWTSETNTNLKTSVVVILSRLSTGRRMLCMVQRSERAPAEIT